MKLGSRSNNKKTTSSNMNGSNYDSLSHNSYTNGTYVNNDLNTSLLLQEEVFEEEAGELYCFCQRGSYGNMVGCDNDNCKYQWFHYECVGLMEEPKGEWFCIECKDKIKKKKR